MATTKGRKAKGGAGTKAARADGTAPAAGAVVQELKLADLDLSPATDVRSRATEAGRKRIDAAVERYAAADDERPGSLPPIQAFRGKSTTYVGDGTCRVEALKTNDRVTVRATVSTFKTDAEARLAARQCAWAANLRHGLHLEDDDKRLIVRDILLSQAADRSDYSIKKKYGFSNVLIRRERERMTRDGTLPEGDQRRSDTPGRYDPDAKQRGGVPVAAPPQKPGPDVQAEVKNTRTDYSDADQSDTPGGDRYSVADDEGAAEAVVSRPIPVPSHLVPVFAVGPLLRELRQVCGKLGKAVTAAADQLPGLAELPAELDAIAVWADRFVAEAVCPRCEGKGENEDGECRGCDGDGFVREGDAEGRAADDPDVFSRRLGRFCSDLDRLKREVKTAAGLHYGQHVHAPSVIDSLDIARRALWAARPTEPCPFCPADAPSDECKGCFGTGRTTAARVPKRKVA